MRYRQEAKSQGLGVCVGEHTDVCLEGNMLRHDDVTHDLDLSPCINTHDPTSRSGVGTFHCTLL